MQHALPGPFIPQNGATPLCDGIHEAVTAPTRLSLHECISQVLGWHALLPSPSKVRRLKVSVLPAHVSVQIHSLPDC